MRRSVIASVIVVCCALLAVPSRAQSGAKGAAPHCSGGIVIYRHKPQEAPRTAPHDTVACVARGNELGGAVAGSRSQRDLSALQTLYYDIDGWRDSAVMHAAVTLARDSGATAQSRAFAVRHLLRLLSPGSIYSYHRLVDGGSEVAGSNGTRFRMPCWHSLASDNGSSTGSPLPRDYEAQIHTLLDRLSADQTAPREVRNAAECAQY